MYILCPPTSQVCIDFPLRSNNYWYLKESASIVNKTMDVWDRLTYSKALTSHDVTRYIAILCTAFSECIIDKGVMGVGKGGGWAKN